VIECRYSKATLAGGATPEPRHLPPDERKAAAELEHELLDVINQSLFDLTLATDIRRTEKIEEVWVLEDFHRAS